MTATKYEPVTIDAGDLEKVAGGLSGWCGNDPKFWKFPPPPPEPWFGTSIINPGETVSLNPQPLPPKAISNGFAS